MENNFKEGGSMKTLNLKIEVEDVFKDTKEKPNITETFTNVILNSMLQFSQQKRGFTKKERIQYYRISKEFDKAVKESKESIEIDDELFGFIRKCFNDGSFTPNTLLERVEKNIDEVQYR